MKSVTISYQINQPEISDYENSYSRILSNATKKQTIFDIITDPENINRALLATEETGKSPITVYEQKIANAISNGLIEKLSWHEKQFVGKVTCLVMESNSWVKTGKKQRFSKGVFKSAEIYSKKKS